MNEEILQIIAEEASYELDTVNVLSADHFTLTVVLNGKELTPERSLKYRNHSPDGFNWGYSGSGPAQLALAICIELFGPTIAQRVYQDFKFKYIASLPRTVYKKDIGTSREILKMLGF